MSLVTLAMRRPLTVIVAVVAVVLVALLALRQMPRDIFPQLGVPCIYVAQPYGGMDPAQMEGYLTYYYEYHFLYITGIEHVESKSIQGAAMMKLAVPSRHDMAQAMAETVGVREPFARIHAAGHGAAVHHALRCGQRGGGQLVFSSDDRIAVGEMQDLALNRVRPLFATLPGVSAPPPFGGKRSAPSWSTLDPDRLRAYGMSPG